MITLNENTVCKCCGTKLMIIINQSDGQTYVCTKDFSILDNNAGYTCEDCLMEKAYRIQTFQDKPDNATVYYYSYAAGFFDDRDLEVGARGILKLTEMVDGREDYRKKEALVFNDNPELKSKRLQIYSFICICNEEKRSKGEWGKMLKRNSC